MKNIIKKLKSNKGFTMQDVIVALIVFTTFAGIIGTTFVYIYQVQSSTKLSATATLCAIEILENMDKISYDEVTNGMESEYRTKYEIPNSIDLSIEVSQYNTEDTIKTVKITMSYELLNSTSTMVLEKIKVKEL